MTQKILNISTFLSLFFLSLGLLTSTSLSSMHHVFIIPPLVYLILNYKKYPISLSKSQIALLLLCFVMILSVLFNQDIAVNGYKPITKTKYYIIGALAFLPFSFFGKSFSKKQIQWLIYVLFFATTLASISGMIGLFSGFNPLKWGPACHLTRNCGVFGMYMNYAHNIVLFNIIITGLFLFRNKLSDLINSKIIIAVLIINMIGLFFSYTRGAWIGLIIGLPFYFFKKYKKAFVLSFIGIIVFFTLAFSFSPMVKDTIANRQGSNDERIGSWKASAMAFYERPLLGYGLLNFEPHSSEIKKRYNFNNSNFQGHSHNNFLQILADTGIMGLVFFLLWIYFWIKEVYSRDDIIAKITFPFILCFLGAGLTQSTFILANNTFFIMAVYAISQIPMQKMNS